MASAFLFSGGGCVCIRRYIENGVQKFFEDVVSQPHITRTLQNELKTGRVGHAYLFTGSRGTEKQPAQKFLQWR